MSRPPQDTSPKRSRAAVSRGVIVSVRLQEQGLAALDAWIKKQPDPQPSRPDAIRELLNRGFSAMREDNAAAKANRKLDAAADAAQARADYEQRQIEEDRRTARLREVRLAKEAREKQLASTKPTAKSPAKPLAKPRPKTS